MYTNAIVVKEERKDKKRGLLFTFFFHAVLVALAIIPFLTPSDPEVPETPQAIMIDFTNFDTAAKQSAKGKRVKKAATAKKTVEKETKVKKTPKPRPKPTPPKPPINTTPEPNPPISPPTKTEVETTPEPTPAPVETPVEEIVEEPVAEEAPAEESTAASSTTADEGTAKETGNEDDGHTEATGKADEGTTGAGEGWVDFGGDGIFNRKVIYRADVKKLTKQEGTIVIKLCISQGGTVVLASYDEENSTIKDKAILKKAELTARKYRFAKDYAAPYKQCGKLTFIFDLDD